MAAPQAAAPDFGENRQYLNDPASAGVTTVTGDLAAAQLQTLQLLRDLIPEANADGRARVDTVAAHMRQALAASNRGREREIGTRDLQPITRIPAQFGNNDRIGNIRMHNIKTFTGTSSDSSEVIRWLDRIMNLSTVNGLNQASTLALMIQGSDGSAGDFITQMRDEDKDISEVIKALEKRYGKLCSVEEARVKANTMHRNEGETLPSFIDRLRAVARMACRAEANDVARHAAMDVLVEANIRRVLPGSVRNGLEDIITNRKRMGLPPLSAREVEGECIELERRRSDRQELQKAQARRRPNINQIFLDTDLSSLSEDSDSGSEEVGEDVEFMINAVREMGKRYATRGKPFDKKKMFKKAFNRLNERRGYARMANEGPQQQTAGPPNRLVDGSKRHTISELLKMARVTRGDCIQCGFQGHYMGSDSCGLRAKPIVDKACIKCSKGLHNADDCPRQFQQQYKSDEQHKATDALNEA